MTHVKPGCPMDNGYLNRHKVLLIGLRGQSNMDKFADMATLQSKYLGFRGDVRIWDGTKFSVMTTSNNTYPGANANKFALEYSLSYHLADATCRQVFLVKHAVGSTSMASDWQVGQTLYENSCNTYDAAMAYMASNGIEFDFFDVFYQGENDSQNSTDASAYQTRYTTHITDSLSRFNPSGYICILTRSNLGVGYSFSPTVQAGQIAAVNSFSDPNMVTVNVDDVNPGQLHHDASGYDEVGLRACNTLLTLL